MACYGVKEDTADCLREKLQEIGLNEKESNELIMYWLLKFGTFVN